MLPNLFLLKVHLCPHVGIVTEAKLFKAFEKCLYNTNIEQCCQIAGLSQGVSNQILASWNSQNLNDEVHRHWLATKFITRLDPEYPDQLKEIYCPPSVIFYAGDISLLKRRLLGVVGARDSTPYGRTVLDQLLPDVVNHGIVTVSGLAKGIDGLCHQLTQEFGGQTIAAIGTGLDITYPRNHDLLQQQVARYGLLLSEYGLGTKPFRSHFPERNRIIAGLSETLLVIEAKRHSGSLITANLALQENRNVCAIPGKITDVHSVGCNEIIAAGATPILDSNTLLNEFLI